MDSEAADIIEQYDQIYANTVNSMVPKEIQELSDQELEQKLKEATLEAKMSQTNMRNLFRSYRMFACEKKIVNKQYIANEDLQDYLISINCEEYQNLAKTSQAAAKNFQKEGKLPLQHLLLIHTPHKTLNMQTVVENEEQIVKQEKQEISEDQYSEQEAYDDQFASNFNQHAASIQEIEDRLRNISLVENKEFPQTQQTKVNLFLMTKGTKVLEAVKFQPSTTEISQNQEIQPPQEQKEDSKEEDQNNSEIESLNQLYSDIAPKFETQQDILEKEALELPDLLMEHFNKVGQHDSSSHEEIDLWNKEVSQTKESDTHSKFTDYFGSIVKDLDYYEDQREQEEKLRLIYQKQELKEKGWKDAENVKKGYESDQQIGQFFRNCEPLVLSKKIAKKRLKKITDLLQFLRYLPNGMEIPDELPQQEEVTQATKLEESESEQSESDEEYQDSAFQEDYIRYKYTIGEDNQKMVTILARLMKKFTIGLQSYGVLGIETDSPLPQDPMTVQQFMNCKNEDEFYELFQN